MQNVFNATVPVFFMQFVIVFNESPLSASDINDVKKVFNDNTSILCDSVEYSWLSGNKRIFFYGRNPNIKFYEKYNVFEAGSESCEFIHGWIKKYDSDVLLRAGELSKQECTPNTVDGFYLVGMIHNDGSGFIRRSLASKMLCFSETTGKKILSNRASICAELSGDSSIDDVFMATHVGYGDRVPFNRTLFSNVKRISPNVSLEILDYDVSFVEEAEDFLFDSSLSASFQKSSKNYWDDCSQRLLSQARAFDDLGLPDLMQASVTGGKDSRLNLAIYKNSISGTFTNPVPYFADTIVARILSNKLQLNHSIEHDFSQTTSNDIPALERTSFHLFLTEGNMSAYDIKEPIYECVQRIVVNGQEYGLRKKPGKNVSLEDRLGEFNKTALLKSDWKEKILNTSLPVLQGLYSNVQEQSKTELLENYIARGSTWVATTVECALAGGFNIYPLCTNTVSLYAYNAGLDAINEEQFHEEVLSRIAPELIDLPLHNQNYKKQKSKRGVKNRVNLYEFRRQNKFLYDNLTEVKRFLLESNVGLENVVDLKKIEKISKNDLRAPLICQCLFNLIHFVQIKQVSHFSMLKDDKTMPSFSEKSLSTAQKVEEHFENMMQVILSYEEDLASQTLVNRISIHMKRLMYTFLFSISFRRSDKFRKGKLKYERLL